MSGFIEEIRSLYSSGSMNRSLAIKSIMNSSVGHTFEDAEDILDGEILSSARRFQALFSMAKVKDFSNIPAELSNLFPCHDAVFGDDSSPDKKLVYQFGAGVGVFYFCFGKSRGVQYSKGEAMARNKWVFKALVLHEGVDWYCKTGFRSDELVRTKNMVYSIKTSDSLQSVLRLLGLRYFGSNVKVNALDFC